MALPAKCPAAYRSCGSSPARSVYHTHNRYVILQSMGHGVRTKLPGYLRHPANSGHSLPMGDLRDSGRWITALDIEEVA